MSSRDLAVERARRATVLGLASACVLICTEASAIPIDEGGYHFGGEEFFADDASFLGTPWGFGTCEPLPPPPPPYFPADVPPWVIGYTPTSWLAELGSDCTQYQELEFGFTDILPEQDHGPDVVVFDAAPGGIPPSTLAWGWIVAVRPLGGSFGKPVLYGAAYAAPWSACPPGMGANYGAVLGVDFERHGLAPGTVVDRIKLIGDCNLGGTALGDTFIAMAAVVDRSCTQNEDCNDRNPCSVDWCDDGTCTADPLPAGTPCTFGSIEGQCDGDAYPHCRACLSNADCGSPTPICHPATFECVGCVLDADCAAPTPFCDGIEGVCKGCIHNLQCDDANDCTSDHCTFAYTCTHLSFGHGAPCSLGDQGQGVCSNAGSSPVCVECLEHEDCTDPERPYCDDERGCVECRLDFQCMDLSACTIDTCEAGSCQHLMDPACSGEGGAGLGGAGGSAAGGGDAAGGQAAVGGAPPTPNDVDDGCSCRLAASSQDSSARFLYAIGLMGLLRRRRKRRTRDPTLRLSSPPAP